MIEAELLTEIRRLRDEVNELKARSFPPEFRMGMGEFGVRGIAWLDSGYRPFEVGSGGVLRPVSAAHWYQPIVGTDATSTQSTAPTLLWQCEFVASGPEIACEFQAYASVDAGFGRVELVCPHTGWSSGETELAPDGTFHRVRIGASFPGYSGQDPVTLQLQGRTGNVGASSVGATRPTPLINGGFLDLTVNGRLVVDG